MLDNPAHMYVYVITSSDQRNHSPKFTYVDTRKLATKNNVDKKFRVNVQTYNLQIA